MTKDQKDKCHYIIHGAAASGAAVGAGLAQLPGADSIALTAIEVAMIISLGQVFDIALSKSGATAMLAGAVGSTVGRVASQFLVGWIPGIGNAINASTAAGVIETLGWAVVKDFEKRAA